MYDLAVIIARMQPMHLEHEKIIREALSRAKKVLLLLGSEGAAPSLRNPFTLEQRATMVKLRFAKEISHRSLLVEGLSDMTYQHDLWLSQAKAKIRNHCVGTTSVLMVYGGRDDSAHLKQDFPVYDHYVLPVDNPISGTAIRSNYFEGEHFPDNSMNPEVAAYVRASLPQMNDLYNEYHAAKAYRESWAGSPFPPMFVAADNLIVWNEISNSHKHLLVIRRKSEFGRGKWALPGGYVESTQTLEEAARAELEQEAGLVIDKPFPEPVMIDAINRSHRGRMITSVFHVCLEGYLPPSLEAGDDADKAIWLPLKSLANSEDFFFSDHFHIIGKFYPEIYNV